MSYDPDAHRYDSYLGNVPMMRPKIIVDSNPEMDYPTAWAFVKGTQFSDHHHQCSYVVTKGALLCDCHVLFPDYP